MISAISPVKTYSIQNVQKVISFCSVPFTANKKEEDVFFKSENTFNEYGLRVQKCDSKSDMKTCNKMIEDEFKLSLVDKSARRTLLLSESLFKKSKSSHYLIKNENGEITGAFHLSENNARKKHYKQLCIAEMCVPQKFHKTKTSYDTLKTIFGFIKDKSKDYDCLTLNVDSNKKSLVRMYKKLGFYVAESDSGYYFMINPLNSNVKAAYPELDVNKLKSIKSQINKNFKKED